MSKFANNEFFIIKSDRLDDVRSKLYGYCITDSGVLFTHQDKMKCPDSFEGCFVWVDADDDNRIVVKQDILGSYGLYLYNDGSYWALSNSLYHLIEQLKSDHVLYVNKEYAKAFLIMGVCSNIYEETLIQQIKELDRRAQIIIDKTDRSYEITLYDYQEKTVPIDSREGLILLDEWYHRWNSIIVGIKKKTNNMIVDLSGGMDSRMVMALFIGSQINLNDIWVNSVNDDRKTHSEDWVIANRIANEYGFGLNSRTKLDETRINLSEQEIMDISLYTKFGIHKEPHIRSTAYEQPVFHFTGSGGEISRGYWDFYIDEFITRFCGRRAESILQGSLASYKKDAEAYLKASIQRASSVTNNVFERILSEKDCVDASFLETHARHHFGKGAVEDYLHGKVLLSPLLDQRFLKLKPDSGSCPDKQLLMALLLTRYEKKLLSFPFEGDRAIKQSTLTVAEELNKKYPLKKETSPSMVFDVKVNPYNMNDGMTGETTNSDHHKISKRNHIRKNPYVSEREISDKVLNAYNSPTSKFLLSSLFSENIYEAIKKGDGYTYQPLRDIYTAMYIIKAFFDQKISTYMNCSLSEYLNSVNVEQKKEITDTCVDNLSKNAYVIMYHSGIHEKPSKRITIIEFDKKPVKTLTIEELGYDSYNRQFKGWIVYREVDDAWYVIDDNGKYRWKKLDDGILPDGFSFEYLTNGTLLSKTAEQGIVHMYAVWK